MQILKRTGCRKKGRGPEKTSPVFLSLVSGDLQEEFGICWEEATAQQPRLSLGAVMGPNLL